MKTYLKEVAESKNVNCISVDGKECHYVTTKCKVKERCNYREIVFIKVDPVKIVEWYERKVNRISKSLNDYLARNQ